MLRLEVTLGDVLASKGNDEPGVKTTRQGLQRAMGTSTPLQSSPRSHTVLLSHKLQLAFDRKGLLNDTSACFFFLSSLQRTSDRTK